jgi:hypothetical protein
VNPRSVAAERRPPGLERLCRRNLVFPLPPARIYRVYPQKIAPAAKSKVLGKKISISSAIS